MKNQFFVFFLLKILLLLLPVEASSGETTYPEEVHQLVIEKLHELRGQFGKDKKGSWGDWSPWTPCSRSCGTGVSTQRRECQSIINKIGSISKSEESSQRFNCVGRNKRFQLCNTQVCPQGLVDFRADQCSSYNKTPFNNRIYTWEPFIDSSDSCTLNCRAVGLSFYATLNQSVIDGTPCGAFRPKTNLKFDRFCVEGSCMKVGCDGLLGSGRVIDSCGICGGDNSSCRVISGIYTRPKLPYGYNLIATLPPGATNLSIYHLKPSNNYLALRELGGNYILNGPSGLNSSGSFEASGTIFTYSRPNSHGGDHLYARGPTLHSLDIMLFFQNSNPGIRYEYRLPMSSGKVLSFQARSGAADSRWPSRVIYPAGRRKSQLEYLEKKQQEWNIFQNGKNSNKKPQKSPSEKNIKKHGFKKNLKNKNKNRFIWEAKGFTECSSPCGGGTQTSRIVCRKRKKGGVMVPPHFCANLPPPKQQVITCNLKPCPPRLEPTVWGDCSVTCGLGVQFRKFICKQKISPEKEVLLTQEECGTQEPALPRAQVCQMKDCNSPPSWEIGPWSKCSSKCGLGTRRRSVICSAARGILDEKFCKEAKPTEEEICDMGSCAVDTWFFSKWDETCKGPCGYGTQTRRLHCSSEGDSDGEDTYSCPKKEKPEEVRRCTSSKQCSGSWFEGPWNECDTQCGIGRQHRAVVCVLWRHGRYKVAKNEADCKGAGERPADTRPCTVDCQAQWFTSEWSKCSSPCDRGVQRREIKCLDHNLDPSMECPSSTKPDSRQYCNTQPCNLRDFESANEVFSPSPNDSSFNTENKIFAKNYAYFEHGGTSFVQSTTDDGDMKLESQSFEGGKNSSKVYLNEGKLSKNISRKVLTENNKFNSSSMVNVSSRKVKKGRETENSDDDVLLGSGSCIDRMKNCFLVYKARLCKLKYYNRLCCKTCFKQL